MDNELLVTEFYKIIDILKKDGDIALFMLQPLDYYINDFSLVISTSTYDNLTKKEALMKFFTILKYNLNKEISKRIMRVTVLKTTDSFVKNINQMFKVTNCSIRYLNSVSIFGVHIENAIILESCNLKQLVEQ